MVMSDKRGNALDPDRAMRSRTAARDHLKRMFRIGAAASALWLSSGHYVEAASFRQGVFAFNHQNYVAASRVAQYSLGLLYDRGQGVPQDIVEAGKWLNLSTAAAPPRVREARARIRDAVTTKMTRGEIAWARLRALEWAPTRER